MWSEFNYTKIQLVLDRVLRHPLLQELSLEAAVQYTIDFISIVGLPAVYEDKVDCVEIKNYRGMLPCDLIAINQVKHGNIYLKGMTDTFGSDYNKDIASEETFKTQGNIIYTSFKEGKIDISYKSIPVDEHGFPMIPDNSIFLKALELYIKKEWFTVLFDLGKLNNAVLQNTQQEYAFRVGQLTNEFIIPSVSEMESITGMLNTLIPRVSEFSKGFKTLGVKEYIKKH